MENNEICKKCGSVLIVKQTKRTADQLKKPYYFSAYYYCSRCQKLYHSDKFKVINPTTMPLHLGGDSSAPKSVLINYDVEIWTDGACVNNGTPKARAAWAFVSGKTEKAGLVEGKQTNNVAEGLAIYHALAWAAEQGYKRVKLSTDSQISLFNLQKDPYKVKVNAEIFHNIAAVIKKHGLMVQYIKVLGHSGDINNDRVDKLANSLARS
jgi:ribonuclease HI